MKTMNMVCLCAAALLCADAALAQVAGIIVTPEGRKIDGTISWRPREKAYAVVQRGGNNVEILMTQDKIKELQIPRPNELVAAIDKIQKGDAASAIPLLEKVSKLYQMLTWDTVATRYLAEAYLKDGDADKAIDVCEGVIRFNPEAAYLGEMAPVYWDSLLKKDRSSKVEELLTQAIKSGDRSASAFAQIKRGDIILKGGDTPEIAKKALRDGYLRVVTLYKAQRDAQPEALYKAAKCFDKLGQSGRADSMRTTLKTEFGASEWAHK
jgi:tetratricopeptide (TPR) repeat protein